MEESPVQTGATSWSLIVRARGQGRDARVALGALLRRYDRTILCHISRWKYPWDLQPQDIKQEFLTEVLARSDLQRLDRRQGRFRDWLKVAVKHHLWRTWKRWLAEKRGNRKTEHPEQFDALTDDPSAEDWVLCAEALDTLDEALVQHRATVRNKERFDALKPFLRSKDATDTALGTLAAELGLSCNALRVAIHYMRERHKRILENLVGDALNVDPADPQGRAMIRGELKELMQAVARCQRT